VLKVGCQEFLSIKINQQFEEYLHKTRKKKLLPFRTLKNCRYRNFRRIRKKPQVSKLAGERRKSKKFAAELALNEYRQKEIAAINNHAASGRRINSIKVISR